MATCTVNHCCSLSTFLSLLHSYTALEILDGAILESCGHIFKVLCNAEACTTSCSAFLDIGPHTTTSILTVW